MKKKQNYKTVVCGSGLAGTGLLFNAVRKNELAAFLDHGIAFLDKGQDLCAGTIGRYIINSDSPGSVFLECIDRAPANIFRCVREHELVCRIRANPSAPVSLSIVGELMRLLGKELNDILHDHPGSAFYPKTEVLSVHRTKSNSYLVRTNNDRDEKNIFHCSSVVLATGGKQDLHNIASSPITKDLDLKNYMEKLFLTDQLFTADGLTLLQQRLSTPEKNRIVIIGSSHSAFSAIWLLLNKISGDFSPGTISLMHRSPLKLFYPNREDAWKDGYFDFREEDICPQTQRVFRLSGLRQDARDVLRQVLGIGGKKEERVQLTDLNKQDRTSIAALLEQASVIIPAFGYRPATVPVYDEQDQPIELYHSKGHALVNDKCQVMDRNGDPVPSLYGIGLASGFNPLHAVGGEPSFRGQANGVWMYQNGVGELIYDQLRA